MKTEIDGFLKNSVVLLDTCSIVEVSDSKAHSEQFWEKLLSMAHASGTKVIISSGVLRELDSHQTSKSKPEHLKKASELGMKKLYSLINAEEVYAIDDHRNTKAGDKEVHADPFFINFVNDYKMSKNIYIFTQDVNLMKDVHKVLELDSLSGKVKGSNGEQITIVEPKKVTVVKVQSGKPDVFKRFSPDKTLKKKQDVRKKQAESDEVEEPKPKPRKKSALPAFKSIGG